MGCEGQVTKGESWRPSHRGGRHQKSAQSPAKIRELGRGF